MLVQAEGFHKRALLLTAAKGINSQKVFRMYIVENKLKLPFSFFLKRLFFLNILFQWCLPYVSVFLRALLSIACFYAFRVLFLK